MTLAALFLVKPSSSKSVVFLVYPHRNSKRLAVGQTTFDSKLHRCNSTCCYRALIVE